jgi:hypothetical protein
MSKSGDINAQNLDRVTLCTRCGYALEGLPPIGRCPECGLAYSPNRIVIFGRAQGRNKTFDGRFSLLTFIYFVLITAYLVADHAIGRRYSDTIQIALATLIFGGAIWRRHLARRDMPAESQVHLSPNGYGFRDGLGDVTIEPWQPANHVRIRALLRDSYRLQIKASTRWFSPDLLDFVFQSDEPTAVEIANRIEQFRHGTKVERDFALNDLVPR